ncbi:MAG: hypothetical protein ABFS86_08660 [Planctomycetota bacterium]
MRLTLMLSIVLALALALAACDEEKPAGEPGRSPLPTPADGSAKNAPGAKQLAEKRLPSGRRLADVLVAEAAGMKRWQEPEVKQNDALGRVTAEAEYYTGDAYRHDRSLDVEVQWFTRAAMGMEKLGFGMYKPVKMSISGFEAIAKHPVPEENDRDSTVRMLVAAQLIVQVETENYDVAAIVLLLEALDFRSLKVQVDDGSIFQPSPNEVIQAGLMGEDAVKALLPAEIRGLDAASRSTRAENDSFAFHSSATAAYQMLGQVTITDAGAAGRAKKRWPLTGIDNPGIERLEQMGQEVKREKVSAAGTEAFVILAGAPGKLEKQATVIWRAHAGRFVLDGRFMWMQPQKGLSEENRKKMGFGLFPDALAQVKGILEELDVPKLSKR